MDALTRTNLPLPGRREGKVRDIYDLPPESPGGPARLLIVATDRISAFDVVMPTPIPGKGRLLTEVSARWFEFIREKRLAPTHVITGDVSGVPGLAPGERDAIRGRASVVRRCRVVPVECVVRGYLDGSGWGEYRQTGEVCGVALPPGLRRGDRLPEPIFTPATKEAVGVHDQNITFERACEIAGADVMRHLREMSLAIYRAAHEYSAGRGLFLADTKFEFGMPEGARGEAASEPILVDEALTPDSSRYWDASAWNPGGEQVSFDKQFLREFLNRLVDQGRWNKQPPGPDLPADVVEGTLARYRAVRDRLFN